jgi:hypothetical protein
VGNYAAMFATSMKKKRECQVYIDIFAGAGRARIETDPKQENFSRLLIPDRYPRSKDGPNLNPISRKEEWGFLLCGFKRKIIFLLLYWGRFKRIV